MRCNIMNNSHNTTIACHALSASKEETTHPQRLQLHALLAGQAALRELVDDAPADVAGAQASQPRVQALLQRMRPLSVCLLRQRARRPSQGEQVFPGCGESTLEKAAQIMTKPKRRVALTDAQSPDK